MKFRESALPVYNARLDGIKSWLMKLTLFILEVITIVIPYNICILHKLSHAQIQYHIPLI